jgi:hypothetical protein
MSIWAQSVSSGRAARACSAGDRCLHLVRAGPAMAHRLVDQGEALSDHLAVPECPILVVEQDDLAVGIEARRGTGVLEQHQGEQPHDLRLGLEQPQQQPRRAGSPPRTAAAVAAAPLAE